MIVEAAGRLFFAPGVARVSMDDLARELGMSKKTIYRHFPDRRSLLAAVLDRQFAARSARWWRRPRTQKGSRSVCGYSGF
ncbi:MAG: TetR/AcrR family transcriptional regulator [Pseudonocardiaceae bacterium]